MVLYRAVVNVALLDRRCRCIFAQRIMEMPQPRVGDEIGFSGKRPEYWSAEVTHCVWDSDLQAYHVEVDDQVSDRLDLTEMVENLGPAWKTLGEIAA